MGEPKFGYRRLIKTQREGKVKAFFDLIVPTESMGNMQISGFKVIQGTSGLFVSLPNRAVPVKSTQTVCTSTGDVTGTVSGIKYFDSIRFESSEKYNEFRKELNDNVLPLIEAELAAK